LGPHGGFGEVPLGQGDLDPFSGGGGGGMIFDPLRVGRQSGNRYGGIGDPRVPPGARYDPLGPFPAGPHPGGGGIGGRRPPRQYPDPDHLPPPGPGGDFFM
jgi:proteasome inhibitor subunit 1 (PI31)